MDVKTGMRYAVKNTHMCCYCLKNFENDFELIKHKDKEHHEELMKSMGIRKRRGWL